MSLQQEDRNNRQPADADQHTVSALPSSQNRPSKLSLTTALSGHKNSLGVIRLVLASAVIVHHAYPLGGFGGDDPVKAWTGDQQSIGGLAVGGFFAVSGYLITKSALRGHVGQFLWRRALRLMPAYWLVLLVSLALVGPVFYWRARGTLAGYWNLAPGGSWGYLRDNMFLHIGNYGIHDIFLDTPYGQQVGSSVFNGSLWTLLYEWRAYLLVALILGLGLIRWPRIAVSGVFALTVIVSFMLRYSPEWLGLFPSLFGDAKQVELTMIFFAGAMLAVFGKQIPFNWSLGIAAWAIVIGTLALGRAYWLFGAPAFAFGLMWLAARLPKWTNRIGSRNDYSYGMYLYGFLVQQCTAALGWHRWGLIPWTLACIALTVVPAVASWHLVEKRAMRLKDRGPGRAARSAQGANA